MPLSAGDSRLLGDVARQAHQPSLASDESRTLNRLTTEVTKALHDVKAVVGARRFFGGSKKRDSGQASAQFLTQFRDWRASTGPPQLLQRLDKQDDKPTEVSVTDALADWVGLRARVTDLGSSPEVVARAVVAELPAAIKTIDKALQDEARFRSDALAAGNAVRKREVRRLVSEMPVDRLKDATRDRLRIGPLTDAGNTTVQAVWTAVPISSTYLGSVPPRPLACVALRRPSGRRRTTRCQSASTSRTAPTRQPSCFAASSRGRDAQDEGRDNRPSASHCSNPSRQRRRQETDSPRRLPGRLPSRRLSRSSRGSRTTGTAH
jgi:hypothetical protein